VAVSSGLLVTGDATEWDAWLAEHGVDDVYATLGWGRL